MSKKRTISPRGFVIKWSAIVGAILVVAIALNVVLFTTLQTVMDNYFRPSVTRSDALTAASSDLTEQIQAEGIVLLKNENGTLPLPEDNRRVNVFGWSSTNPVYGGTGSGAVDTTTATTFLQGLEEAGIEYNREITDFYRAYRTGRPAISIRAQDWTVPEPSMDEYDAAGIFDSAEEFSETAVVMISRSGGEGADLSRTLAGNPGDIQEQELPDGRVVPVGSAGSEYPDDVDPDKHYLELSNRERALMERITAEFDDVIVLLNTGNVFELGWVNELDVDSVAWIGGPGETGFRAVGDMLNGTVNPSGRTVDTWPYDLLGTPESGNFGRFHYLNSEDVDAGDVPISYSGDPATAPGYQFVNYAEGIYVGYRYWETRYQGDEAGYRAAVQYPFGHGLSYSTFEQELVGSQSDGDTATFEVTVTNTGDIPGKEVVQLYVTAPYAEGGIEKAHVSLAAFTKTDVLDPGASETVTLEVLWEDITSWDITRGAYVLEAGDYEFKLMRNSHEVIDSSTHAVTETVVYDGNNQRSSDLEPATTRFTGAQGELEVLSRMGNFANHDETLVLAQDREMTDAERQSVRVELPDTLDGPAPVVGADNDLSLDEVVGLEYDDPTWDRLLDQLSVDEMRTLISLGGYQTKPVDSVDKPATFDIDGPQGLSSFMGASVRAGAYPTAIVIASTWNVDLAEARGQTVGYEALELGVNGWYAPGVNLHRSPFAGRNFEYYSEDPLISGLMGSTESRGAQGQGLYVYIKHFVLNEQETYRNSRLLTWVDEQTLREIYLKPFEYVIKEGGATAVMSAFNYVGGIWAGGNDELLNGVLRDEWGFRGMVITDYFGAYGYMNANQAIANGGDLMLSTLGLFGATPEGDSDAVVAHMRRATKNILYTVANSNAMYTDAQRNEMLAPIGGEVTELSGIPRLAYDLGLEAWVLVAYAANALVGLLLIWLVIAKVRKYRRLFDNEDQSAVVDQAASN